MAEFLTMDEAKSKFGTKGRTNAGLTLGIIGTALAAFAGNNHSVVTTRIYRTITCNNYKRCNKLNKHSRRPNLF